MRLEGAVAIVTGAGSGTGPNQGIGKAFARAFLREGAKVVVGEIDEGRGKEVVEDLRELGDISLVQVDVTNQQSARAMAEEVVVRHGRIDTLINNAGIYGDMARVMESVAGDDDPSMTFLQRVMNVNMYGPWIVSRAVVPTMVAQGRGHIINISSDAAFRPQQVLDPGSTELPNWAYAWSKWNLVGLTRFMAPALGPSGITVNTICPGITMSDATQDMLGQGAEGETRADIMTATQTMLKQKIDPDDIANAAVFLTCAEGAKVTGQVLRVDSGMVVGW